ncbi:hypothetical protein C8R43DRAFT_1084779 [Mycena crocata]|nr:hypothetical protein C8R43DRAFT_1084779 [Mycena crocata]
MIPYDDELAKLAVGVPAHDALSGSDFVLHAYNILEMGDIVAIEKCLNIKGHNGYSPCRSCEIKGVRNVTGGDTIYYVPLTKPLVPGQPQKFWSARKLPLRNHERVLEIVAQLDACETATARNNLSKFHGIKVRSHHYGKSAPWEFMHLAFENTAPNLVKHWSGKFKGLDTGIEDYEISDDVWEVIWKETADAVRYIPSDFVRVLGDNPSYYTAEAWCFWIVYLAPILLKGRFRNEKYHTHLCQFSEIVKRCIGFEITYQQIDELETDIIDWVGKYEE